MYGKYWDQYYLNTYSKRKEKALWDVDADLAAALDLAAMQTYFQHPLPILDLGCGTGQQTAFLATKFERAVGVDVSSEAIKIAQKNYESQINARFEVLDVTDTTGAVKLQQAEGYFNVYMRGLLHQIKEHDLPSFHQVMATLLGKHGRLFCVEVGTNIRAYFQQSSTPFSKLPARMQQVFLSNLPPRGLSTKNVQEYFPPDQFRILDHGEDALRTNLKFQDGSSIEIPAIFVAIELKTNPF